MDHAPLASPLSPALGAERAALERFVAERFLRVYGARLSHFCAHLVGLRGADGAWRAAAGYTAAGSKSLFLEQYLDAPVEALLAAASGRPVARERIAEVGNLAAAVGMGRELIPAVGAHLHALPVRGERDKLVVLVRNLLDNAARHAPEDSTVRVELRVEGGRATLAVADQGPGIPHELRDRVFESYYRIPGSPGDGSGLAIVREIAAQHGATVAIDDDDGGRGARVSVSFPG